MAYTKTKKKKNSKSPNGFDMKKCMSDMMKGGKSPKEASMICKGMNNK